MVGGSGTRARQPAAVCNEQDMYRRPAYFGSKTIQRARGFCFLSECLVAALACGCGFVAGNSTVGLLTELLTMLAMILQAAGDVTGNCEVSGCCRVISTSSSSSLGSLAWLCSSALLLELSLFILRRYFHFLTEALLPKAYRYRSVSSAFILEPSGSSKVTEREEADP